MKWFDKLFHRQPEGRRYAPTLDGFTPIYSQFGNSIYASDVVQQAVKQTNVRVWSRKGFIEGSSKENGWLMLKSLNSLMGFQERFWGFICFYFCFFF